MQAMHTAVDHGMLQCTWCVTVCMARHQILYTHQCECWRVQVDVIEAQSSILSQCIAHAQDFSEAERAHQTFLDAVVTQSFLDMKAISQMLEGIFSLCQRLCGFVQVSTIFPLHCSHAVACPGTCSYSA